MIDWNLYVWFGRSESIYKIVSEVVRLIVWVILPSFKISAFAGKEILLVLNLIHASVQLVSTNVKFILGSSSGGMGLSLLQEDNIRDENNKAEINANIFITPFILFDVWFPDLK
jgi:hypothetical protein